MRRRSSNDGVLGGMTSVLGMRHSLVRSLMASMPPEQKKVSQPHKGHGRPDTKGPDEMVLEIRRLREQVGLECGEIVKHMANLGFKLTIERVYQLSEYYTRSNLIPAPNAEPYIKEKQCTT